MKDTYLSIVRHFLTSCGGYLVAHGYLTQSDAMKISGALLSLAGFLWGSLDEWIAARKVEEDARIAKEVQLAVSLALAAAAKPQAAAQASTPPAA